ncbi:hypothetical protein BC835DRAFT_1311737, partial [Cytidiella melzeri]
MRKARIFKTGSLRQVNKTKLVAAAGVQEAHPHARGLRRGIAQHLNCDGIERDHLETQTRIDQGIAGLPADQQRVLIDSSVIEHEGETEGIVINVNMDGNEDQAYVDLKANAEDLGVHETFVKAIQDMSRWNGHWCQVAQAKTWRSRVVRQQEAWGKVFDLVTQEYLTWRRSSGSQGDDIAPEPQPDSDEAELRPGNKPEPLTDYLYTVNVFNIDTLARLLTVHQRADSISPALDLMRNGYVAKSPSKPTVAVSINTLALLYQLRQRKPLYSIEAFAKVVCDYYNMPYRQHLREIFGDTFEIYLCIMRSIHAMIYKTLGWDEPDWRVKNACRACYLQEDEPPLHFGRLIAMDGNNSLKRIATTAHRTAADTRTLDDSNYFVPLAFVDCYANEVRGKASKGPAVKRKNEDSDDESNNDHDLAEGNPTDGLRQPEDDNHNDPQSDCKKMWGLFDESGVFAAACRHGLALWLIDMVCSGELAKYPLAIVSKTLELLEERPLVGYDVGCSFSVTTEKSSLGPAFTALGGCFCVCAFHSYSHSYTCQLEYHPNVITGAGLGFWRQWRESSALQTCLHQSLVTPLPTDLDEDKYLNTGTFNLNNYKQALNILHNDATTLAKAMHSLSITDDNLDSWEREEVEFFLQIGDEDPHNLHAVAYIERLQELRDLDSHRHRANSQFLTFAPAGRGSNYAHDLLATRRIETEHCHANERYTRVHKDVCALKLQMGIGIRWTPTTPEYIAALRYIKERKYRCALDKLQKLVTQQLFELQRLNVVHTGYKMRTHIMKSLQTQCKANQQAITAYNAAAAALDPPRPPLNWSGRLSLSRAIRPVTRHLPGQPAVCACLKMCLRICRTREEIDRLNIEVRRVHTAIRDKRILFRQIRDRLIAVGDPMLGVVIEFTKRRQQINSELLSRVHQVYSLVGYTGVKGAGNCLGSLPLDDNPD